MNTKLQLILSGILLSLASVSMAGDVTVGWTPPTQYQDGSPLPANEIQNYIIYWGTDGVTYPNQQTVAGDQTSLLLTDLAPGTYYLVARTVATNGISSANSNQVSKQVLTDSPPNAPIIFIVQ